MTAFVPETPALCDALDGAGLPSGVPRGLRLVAGGPGAVAGPARTATVTATDEPGIPGLADLLDSVLPGEVLVLGWGAEAAASVWGGLAATRTAAAGGVGLVTDGWVRDVAEVRELALVVWAHSTTPLSGKGRLAVTRVGEPTLVGGVEVRQGDLVAADTTGVCACPAEHVETVLASAGELMRRDESFRAALADGAGFAEARSRAGTM